MPRNYLDALLDDNEIETIQRQIIELILRGLCYLLVFLVSTGVAALCWLFLPSWLRQILAACFLLVGVWFLAKSTRFLWPAIKTARYLRSIFDQYERAHEAAINVLGAHELDTKPFALFLRNFELDSFTSQSQADATWEHFEKRLARAFEGRVPIIGIADRNVYSHAWNENKPVIPRLILPTEGWEKQVEDLVEAAALIIVFFDVFSPGMEAELDVIKRKNRPKDTLLVVSFDRPLRKIERYTVRFHPKFSAMHENYSDVKKDDVRLKPFPNVLEELELPKNDAELFNRFKSIGGFGSILGTK